MNNWIVYKHISPSGKVYIGITGNTPAQRWIRGKGYGRQSIFYNAIQKYGWDNIEHKVLVSNLTKEQAEDVEIQLISYYKSIGISYNVTDGGEGTNGYKHSDEWKKQCSEWMKNRIISKETIQRRKETMQKHPYHPTEDAKRRISAAAKLVDHTKASHIAALKRSKYLYLIDDKGTILKEFQSQQDMAKAFGVSEATIYKYIGRNKSPRNIKGFIVLKDMYNNAQLKED